MPGSFVLCHCVVTRSKHRTFHADMKSIAAISFALLISLAPLASAAGVRERASTLADQQSVNLTIYNGGVALIHDQRRVYLDAGLNRVAWRDVSAGMEPSSAIVDASN